MRVSTGLLNRRFFGKATLAAAALGLLIGLSPQARAADNTLVLAAASMKDSLEEVAKLYEQNTGKKVALSFAASSALAKQIEQQAPADIFISADLDWMDYLAKRDLIKPESRSNLVGNKLVLIAPKAVASPITIEKGNFPVLQRLGNSRLATGEPNSVPGRQIRQGGADASRRLGRGRAEACPGGKRSLGDGLRVAGRSAAGHRL